ncbi:aldo/keto reductase [Actinopolymorpha singaporensis]|uniref:Predicted oxidoreductase n=1 Tax=Actinopolymorpha singaporensis TaxID=117157 RepID=A0A1H1PH62_9ACTN|nr:aldo/keto reductase [Actinopolymorpha singaporensis]SDS09989.1 Predicted oxidoreductase [Actinopolymorpha singaporensis]
MLQRTIGGRRTVSALCLGAMNFGSTTDPETSTAILDRFVEAGGTFVDTANNYNQWMANGGESEELLGRWMRSRGNRDQLVIATKCGARTTVPGTPNDNWEGLGAAAVESAVKGSLNRLDVDRIDLYYAHIDNRTTPLEETVGAFGRLAAEGVVDVLGCSNTATWRLERARRLAADQGVEPYSVIQQHYTYLWPSPLVQGRTQRLGSPNYQHAGVEHFDYLGEHRDLTLVAYQPLLTGSYGRPERPFPAARGYAHPSAYARFQVLREVAQEVGATTNQVVLAWMLHHDPVVVPLFGASSLAQLEEALGAVEISLDAEQLDRLNNA